MYTTVPTTRKPMTYSCIKKNPCWGLAMGKSCSKLIVVRNWTPRSLLKSFVKSSRLCHAEFIWGNLKMYLYLKCFVIFCLKRYLYLLSKMYISIFYVKCISIFYIKCISIFYLKCIFSFFIYLYTGWETKFFWHSPKLGSVLYSLYKISLAQACFPLARPNFHTHWSGQALVSQTENVSIIYVNCISILYRLLSARLQYLCVLAMEILQYCTKPSICKMYHYILHKMCWNFLSKNVSLSSI